MITQQQINSLADVSGKNLVSVVVPIEPVGASEKNRIRLKNALQKAKDQLTQRGMSDQQAVSFLAKGNSFVDEANFTDSSSATALFIGDDIFEQINLTKVAGEAISVSEQFDTSLLTQELDAEDKSFFLLTISRGSVKLFVGRDGHLDAIDTQGVIPEDMEAALLLDDPNRQLQRTGRDNSNGTVFGHGAGKDEESGHLKAFLDVVDRGVTKLLRNETRPLLLAGVTELVAIYREANGYNHLVKDAYISGNVDDVPTRELYNQATTELADYFGQQAKRDLELFGVNYAKGEASTDLDDIVPAATNGRVAVLWVAHGNEAYGTYDPSTNGVARLNKQDDQAQNLYALALSSARNSGARVYQIDAEEMPHSGATICAIYRYTVPAVTTNLN